MDVQKQIEDLRRESKEDFKFTMVALDSVVRDLNSVARELKVVQGKMARQEERFEVILDLVQREIDKAVDPQEILELKKRVEALEKRLPPAA